MARRLHDEHGFSYDHLKVLLGGIHAWEQAGYPLVIGPTPTPNPLPTYTPIPLK